VISVSNVRKLLYLRQAMRNQWLKKKEIEEIQRRMMRGMIVHAYDNVPFYHRKFREAGVTPDDIRTVEDLRKIPITTKKELKENFSDLIARGVDPSSCWMPRTSGSTGIPLKAAYGRRDEDYQKAIALRPNLACGQHLRDPWAVLTAPHHILDKKHWFQKLRFLSPSFVNIFADLQEQIRLLEEMQPRVIDGYPSALYLLAREMKRTGRKTINPEIIFSTAEHLSPEMREGIESTFGIRMYDQFGCVEMGRTAWECPEHAGYHMDIDAVVMEFLRDGEPVAPGERGEIVYTGLYHYAMPRIRYAVGDVGVPTDEECPCGRGLPLMKEVEGRSDSFIQTPDGRIYPQMTFWAIMRTFAHAEEIAQFRVIQERTDAITVPVVRGKNYREGIDEEIRKHIIGVLGEDVKITVSPVDELPRDPTGKVRTVISNAQIQW